MAHFHGSIAGTHLHGDGSLAPARAPSAGGGVGKRRLPAWAKQPGKPYAEPERTSRLDRLRADDAAILAMVQGLYDSGAFKPQAETA